MKKTLLLLLFSLIIFSCNKENLKIAEENIKKYLQSNSNGEYKVQEIKLLKLDTITNLHLKQYLINFYSYQADHNLELAKKIKESTESNLNLYRLSKSLNSGVLSDNYKSDFDKNMKDFKTYNDSAKFYNDIVYKLENIKPDSLNFQYYEAKVYYKSINKDKTIEDGDDMYIFLNKDFNIIESQKMVKIAKKRLLE